ncbi:hypothetical protein KZZ52_49980 [Dactylosporangium sp. AC04546]|uniref:hypothetical protein n=1 Tax=Dactylosporangium sp. AC04546 TaxID=2862460 RepID=UPI001EDD9F14|nr:hypothetical protein [Dactylosporangium sp. AC04546]WVK82014.1 hypothetical protein KZZ52_49980 [Dactylosporangium sp. AC04546]
MTIQSNHQPESLTARLGEAGTRLLNLSTDTDRRTGYAAAPDLVDGLLAELLDLETHVFSILDRYAMSIDVEYVDLEAIVPLTTVWAELRRVRYGTTVRINDDDTSPDQILRDLVGDVFATAMTCLTWQRSGGEA